MLKQRHNHQVQGLNASMTPQVQPAIGINKEETSAVGDSSSDNKSSIVEIPSEGESPQVATIAGTSLDDAEGKHQRPTLMYMYI